MLPVNLFPRIPVSRRGTRSSVGLRLRARVIFSSHLAQVLFDQFSVDIEGSDVEQDEQHAAALGLAQILPHVVATAVDTAVTAKHATRLAAVEREEELALDDNAVVDAHSAVDWALHGRREVGNL